MDSSHMPTNAVKAFLNAGYEISDFEEAYQGDWAGGLYEYAEQMIEDFGWLESMVKAGIDPSYFDIDAFVRDLEMDHWTAPSEHLSSYVFRYI